MRSKYIGKIETICLLLIAGVDPKKLRIEYPDMTDADIQRAKEKLERLGLTNLE